VVVETVPGAFAIGSEAEPTRISVTDIGRFGADPRPQSVQGWDDSPSSFSPSEARGLAHLDDATFWFDRLPTGDARYPEGAPIFGFDLDTPPPGEGPLRIALNFETYAAQAALDGESAQLVPVADPYGATLRVTDLSAWDAEGTPLYARMRAEDGELVLRVEDEDAVYPIVVDPVLTSTAVDLPGTSTLAARAGYGLATLDVNDDGFDDLVVGEPYFDGADTDTGRVQLYLGSAAGLASTPVWTYEGLAAFDRVGRVLAGVGNVDAANGEDLAIGVPDADPSSLSGAGTVLLFHALAASPWLASTPDRTFAGTATFEACGGSIADAGDYNADGVHDLAYGCPEGETSTSSADPGRVHVHYGMPGGPPPIPDLVLEGASGEDEFGSAVASAGDVDGDGDDDLLVGAEDFQSANHTDDGWVGLYLGSAAGLGATPSRTWLSNQQGSRLGTQLAGAGDVNGDGFDDVLFGAYQWDGDFTNEGRTTLHLGSPQGPSAAPAFTWLGGQATAYAAGKETSTSSGGRGLALGDVDGDGLADVVTSAWRYDGVGTDSGRVEVHSGTASGVAPYPAWVGGGPSVSARAGYALALGDFDGDGDDDLALGEWGLNSNDGHVRVLPGPLRGEDGAEVVSAGSSNSTFAGSDRWRATVIEMTQDAVLAEIEAELSPSTATPLLFTVYEAATTAGPYTQVAQFATTGTPGNTWESSGPTDFVLQAGNAYLISAWWQDSLSYHNSAESLPQPLGSYGNVVGYRTGSGSPPTTVTGSPLTTVLYPMRFTLLPTTDADADGTLAATDCQDAVATNAPAAPEVCDGLDNDCDGSADFAADTYEVSGTTVLASTNYLKGNRVLANEDRLVTGVEVYLEASFQGAISLGIYESTSNAGPWTLLAEHAVVPTSTSPDWHAFDGLAVPLTAGTHYAFVYQWAGGASYYWSSGSVDPTWGSHEGGLSQVATSLPLDGATITTNPSRYRMRVHTSLEVDGDGDGSFACVDCDDGDATLFPGQIEACDGLDNDCNGVADADPLGEVDGDSDGFRSCAECDDGDSLTFPGATEQCDGADNDCNGAVPSNEGDVDLDGVMPCAGDCDDSDPTAYTGAEELCDLVDNDCDGTADDDARVPIVGSGGPVPPTGTSGLATFTVPSPADGIISDVDVLVDISHTWVGDLEVTITSPLGTSVLLAENRGSSGSGYSSTVFDDEASTSIASGIAPFAGSFTPEDPLSALDGELLGGTWTLDVDDEVSSDSGTLLGWEVQAAIAGQADTDSDNSTACFDCDDGDPAVFPGATEVCDGVDTNCDGALGTGEVDADNDGILECDGDCDDGDPDRFPGNPEVCDGLDNDCDGVVPAGEVDGDLDGVLVCAGDCDDARDTVYPGAPELCDGWDNDCVGGPAEVDGDGDDVYPCTFVASGGNPLFAGGDCDDGNSAVFPGAPEVCDGIDNNCNGTAADEGVDLDGDGETTCTDCDDGNPQSFTGAPELCDGYDNDCNGALSAAETDGDSDLFFGCTYVLGGNPAFGGGDCDDTNPVVFPGAVEACDGLDTDCTGAPGPTEVDGDSDTVLLCAGDCDDADPATFPGATEVCDGADNDCNGALPAVEGDDDLDTFLACAGDCDDTNNAVYPGAAEACDGLDTDCDGTLPADEQDADSDGQSACAGDCDDTEPAVRGGLPEVCDGLDNNCDGTLPTNEQDGDGDGVAPCLGDCNDSEPAMVPGATEACDGLDNDCDGVVPADEVDADVDGVRICAGDCDDGAATVFPGATEACNGVDDDCDATTSAPGGEQDGDSDGSLACADCDDADPANAPGAPEQCDGVDNDCNGLADLDTDGEVDADGDGSLSCEDCEDSLPTVFPGNPEVCDGLDNDCDSNTEAPGGEGDGDSDGSPACADCDDNDGANAPGNPELCDGQDNDCDATTEAAGGEVDGDSDGAFSCDDCDDADATTYPGAPEGCDGVDNDCDGVVPIAEADNDGDGWLLCDGDCNDSAVDVFPGADEVCDGQDNDCDSATNELSDLDGDGFSPCDGDCDDTLAGVFPGALEVCDGLDTDCDATTDELVDDDGDGFTECDGDCEDAESTVNPAASEICDGFDTDCDPITNLAVPEVDADGDGSFLCDVDPDCDDDDPDTYPGAPELCDGADNNCDGTFDDAIEDSDGDGFSPCDGDCDDSVQAVNPNALEGCDGLDTDCDGVIPDDELDEDFDGGAPCDGDCDDTTPSVGPHISDEVDRCDDGLDNDCDGVADAEDPDCQVGDDDDSAADDDDDAADDDDSVAPDDPDEPGCSCQSSVGGGRSTLFLLPLLFAVRRRRRAA